MKVAIMQPYFFPYIGYFQLIHAVDRFIINDNVQYIKQGWINRNRILKPAGGWQYIIAPIKAHSSKELIKNISVAECSYWKARVIHQFDHYKKSAPYYNQVKELVALCLGTNEVQVSKLNANILKVLCDYLGIDFKVEMESEMNFDYSSITSKSIRPLRSLQLNATTYVNAIGGVDLYCKEELEKYNLNLKFLKPGLHPYDQKRGVFEPGLSILDVLMFNSLADVKLMMHNYKLI